MFCLVTSSPLITLLFLHFWLFYLVQVLVRINSSNMNNYKRFQSKLYKMFNSCFDNFSVWQQSHYWSGVPVCSCVPVVEMRVMMVRWCCDGNDVGHQPLTPGSTNTPRLPLCVGSFKTSTLLLKYKTEPGQNWITKTTQIVPGNE